LAVISAEFPTMQPIISHKNRSSTVCKDPKRYF
jgi:hypothetical protein